MATDVKQFFEDLDGGVFQEKLARVLTDVSHAVIDHDGTGKVQITLDMKRIANSHQVTVKHRVDYARPTKRGKVTEQETTETPMYVGRKGLTFFPENQTQMFDKQGRTTTSEKE